MIQNRMHSWFESKNKDFMSSHQIEKTVQKPKRPLYIEYGSLFSFNGTTIQKYHALNNS